MAVEVVGNPVLFVYFKVHFKKIPCSNDGVVTATGGLLQGTIGEVWQHLKEKEGVNI